MFQHHDLSSYALTCALPKVVQNLWRFMDPQNAGKVRQQEFRGDHLSSTTLAEVFFKRGKSYSKLS